MADTRAEQQKVTRERRIDERLECNCDATVLGFRGIQEITDISLGGLFLIGDVPDRIEIGQVTDINTKLPTERYVTRFKAKVIRKTYGGIGCAIAICAGLVLGHLVVMNIYYYKKQEIYLKFSNLT